MNSSLEPSVGFLILSHNSPAQLLRLTWRLTRLYKRSPIVIHHDFSQSPIDQTDFPKNCHFVRPSIRTGWGKWALVEAMLEALKLLYDIADPDYFFLLSASDYPSSPPENVLQDLAEFKFDAFIDTFDLELALLGEVEGADPHFVNYRTPDSLSVARRRYVQAQLKVPLIRFNPPPFSSSTLHYPRLGRATVSLPIKSFKTPFSSAYKCFVGSQWFTASRLAGSRLLNPNANDQRLKQYYRSRVVPDESYVQTVLCNDATLLIRPISRRFVIWEGAHPRQLGSKDYKVIQSANCHFARKFRADDPVLDQLDGLLKVK